MSEESEKYSTIPLKWKDTYNIKEVAELREKIKNAFSDIVFEPETHKYFLDGKELECVSHIVSRYEPFFDSQLIAEQCATKYGMTKEYYLKKWKKLKDDACFFGTTRHTFGENVFYWATGQSEKCDTEFLDDFEDGVPTARVTSEKTIMQFWMDIPKDYIPLLAETKVYDKPLRYAGTFDLLFYYMAEKPEDRGVLIFDYKTNGNLYRNFKKQRLKKPFDNMLDMAVNRYAIQLSLYQIPLERLGVKVIGRRLIWIRKEGIYQKIKVSNLTPRLRRVLVRRKKNVIVEE